MFRSWQSPIVLALLSVGLGCASIVPPHVRAFAPIDPEVDPLLYVVTNDEHEHVIAALRSVGFKTTTNLEEASLVLNVKLGGRRANRSCGSVRNVSFDLRHSAGVRIATVQARGWTGRCRPNMLLDCSEELATLFLSIR